jgi:hypothetical protein
VVASKSLLLFQLLGTAAALGWVPGNGAKLAVMLAVWAICFGRLSRRELLAMAGIGLLFAAMDLGALDKGVFRFERPDFLGLPVYEYVIWGFYTLNALRLIGGAPPRGRPAVAIGAAVVFAVPFMTVADPTMLTLAAGVALALALAVFHEPLDFAYTAYFAAMGAVIEYVGTATGQWSYPGTPYGGIPVWSAIMWAGIGLFTRRLLQPVIYREPAPGGAAARPA